MDLQLEITDSCVIEDVCWWLYFLSNEDYIDAFHEYRIDEPVHKIDRLMISLYDDINVLFRFILWLVMQFYFWAKTVNNTMRLLLGVWIYPLFYFRHSTAMVYECG